MPADKGDIKNEGEVVGVDCPQCSRLQFVSRQCKQLGFWRCNVCGCNPNDYEYEAPPNKAEPQVELRNTAEVPDNFFIDMSRWAKSKSEGNVKITSHKVYGIEVRNVAIDLKGSEGWIRHTTDRSTNCVSFKKSDLEDLLAAFNYLYHETKDAE